MKFRVLIWASCTLFLCKRNGIEIILNVKKMENLSDWIDKNCRKCKINVFLNNQYVTLKKQGCKLEIDLLLECVSGQVTEKTEILISNDCEKKQ